MGSKQINPSHLLNNFQKNKNKNLFDPLIQLTFFFKNPIYHNHPLSQAHFQKTPSPPPPSYHPPLSSFIVAKHNLMGKPLSEELIKQKTR